MAPRLMTVYEPPTDPLRVIHLDEELLLVSKPSGLLSVPGKPEAHRDCLHTRVEAAYPEALLIHRLDLETSGIMVFAMNKRAQKLINGQFERRIVQKTYIARVEGQVAKDEGLIELPLIADWPNRPMQKVCFETGKPASTDWSVMAREASATRMHLKPKTGRSHQLRVHMKELGHPIIGDSFYGTVTGGERLQLHAETLHLRHPRDGEWVAFTDPCPF